eukprot:CAMPEP_0194345500 /NCGR_PEP_ID=MMETSP0171-20130528/104885_1 /TAXON_ID=218684 /ORGANISM="Corethron pennatum, Strain L29A3" /LENGTH=678 /DNA_ID=CAMNT_0039112487 /DNA_START=467 /DNA_END=2501 /DNA_ORIENTATION=-
MGLFGTYIRAEGGAHRRFKTEPIRACILSSLLLASVSISYVSSDTTEPAIQSDRTASSTTRTLIGDVTQDDDGSGLPHMGCKGLLDDKIPPQKKLVGADYYAKNVVLLDAGGYSPAEAKGKTSAVCKDGKAAGYPCNNVNLLSMLDLNELNVSLLEPDGGKATDEASDIWGWTDEKSKREFAIIGLQFGTAFVEITNPYKPVYLGALLTSGDPDRDSLDFNESTWWRDIKTYKNYALSAFVEITNPYKPVYLGALLTSGDPDRDSIEFNQTTWWRDIKTYKNYALVVSEYSNHGMQIFDLTTLLTANPKTRFEETARYSKFGKGHNVFVNEDTSYAYAVGTDTCKGGLHFVNLKDPATPKNGGCYSQDGYTHDVQCVVYAGPDQAFIGREICFAANEDTITIVNVSNKKEPKELSRTSYDNSRYTHQGWLTEDQAYFIFDDEIDEKSKGGKTQTFVLDVRNLSKPVMVGAYSGRTDAIDHNLYIVGDLVYQANYRAGLNVLQIEDISKAKFIEGGYFDVYPNDDTNNFNGAWSNYPFFPSGVVIISGMEQGLFMLEVGDITSPPTASPTRTKTPTISAAPTALAFWKLKTGKPSQCEISDDRRCVTDGAGSYKKNEKCTYVALRDMRLVSSGVFETEASDKGEYDRIIIGGKKYFTDFDGKNNFPESLTLAAGKTVQW